MAGAVRQVGDAKFFADGRALMQASGTHPLHIPFLAPKRKLVLYTNVLSIVVTSIEFDGPGAFDVYWVEAVKTALTLGATALFFSGSVMGFSSGMGDFIRDNTVTTSRHLRPAIPRP